MDLKILTEFKKIVREELLNVVTKEDLSRFATKADFNNFVTKDDLIAMAKRLEEKFVTKTDLRSLKEELIKEIREVEVSVTISADKNKADKADLERLEKRVDKIEQKLSVCT